MARGRNERVLTEQEKEFIVNNVSVMTDKELSEELSRVTNLEYSAGFIAYQRRKLGIKKERGRGVCRVQS